MKIRRYEIREFENGLGDVYYEVDAIYGWLGLGRYTLGNKKHTDAYINGKVPEPYCSSALNYLYIFRTLKDVYKAIEDDKHDRLAKNFKEREPYIVEVEDETT